MCAMKAIRVHDYGGPDQLRYEEVPVPESSEGQVLVRVQAASVNPIDFKLASGVYKDRMPVKFPWIPGGDFAGVVEVVGPGVTGLQQGDAVYGDMQGGGGVCRVRRHTGRHGRAAADEAQPYRSRIGSARWPDGLARVV